MEQGYRADLAENAGAGNGTAKSWPGGKGYFMAKATWGGGNAKLQMQMPTGDFIDVPNATLSANGCVAIDIPAGQIRVVITTLTAVYAYAVKN